MLAHDIGQDSLPRSVGRSALARPKTRQRERLRHAVEHDLDGKPDAKRIRRALDDVRGQPHALRKLDLRHGIGDIGLERGNQSLWTTVQVETVP